VAIQGNVRQLASFGVSSRGKIVVVEKTRWSRDGEE
jgi:hypothetical protein